VKAEAESFAAETPQGRIYVYRNDKPIADALQQYGEWAGIETGFLQQFIPAQGVVVDAGCHIGLHSAAFAEGRPGLTIHAFEPQPALLELAARNTEMIRGRTGASVRLHPVALGAAAGTAFMPRLDFSHPTNAGAGQVSLMPIEAGISVEMIALDSLDLPPVSFIKLDLEGHEGDALRGAHRLLLRDRPTLFCEINTVVGAARIFDALKDLDYQAYFVETDAYNPRNHLGQAHNLFGHARESGLLLLARGAPAPTKGAVAVLEPVADLDAVARLLEQTPRYGDETPHERKPARLKAEMQALSAMLTTAQLELASLTEARARVRQQLQDEITQAEHSARIAEQQFQAANQAVHQATQAALSAQAAHQAAQAEQAQLTAALRVERDLRLHMTRQLMQTCPTTVSKGWKSQVAWMLGRSPLALACRQIALSGLFDRRWYRRMNPDVAASAMHPLVHYLLFGAYEGRQPNPVFDSHFYLRQNADVRETGMNPLLHYVVYGEAEGRAPAANFLPAVYLARNPRLKQRKLSWRRSPLRHFLRHGRTDEPVIATYRPDAPAWSAFETLAASPVAARPAVLDVIVPVYKGYADTFACLLSVLQSKNQTPYELIVIDDCSPDPRISADLQRLADLKLITLLRNEKNLGFVGTANRGMALHEDRDVLLLNSDTLVFNDWVDRIRAHTQDAKVASVTPFTNNGTICSYPHFCRDNNIPPDIGYAALDRLAAGVNSRLHVEVPTGVGFCMYIARAALNEVGLFDVASFGAGYGEENDFCMRALNAGWRNVHALDAFVFHSGETSFAEGAAAGKKRGYETLLRLHPDYESRVQRYVKADPVQFARIALDIARSFGRPVSPLTLCFTHSWGGGIDRHLEERRMLLNAAGKDLLIAMPAHAGSLLAKLIAAGNAEVLRPSNIGELHLVDVVEPLCKALRLHGIEAIEVHSTVGWSVGILQAIRQISDRLGIRYSVVLHDYVPACPQITFINESGRYCGEVGPEQCKSCLTLKPERMQEIHADWKPLGIEDWRQRYADFLGASHGVSAPSRDAAQRLHRYFPQLAIEVQPHISLMEPTHAVRPPLEGGKVRIAIIGAIGPHKGSRVLQDCANDALARKLPLHFTVIGYTDLPALTQHDCVTITGQYREQEVYEVLASQQPHLIFLPSVWPETFSYTLSIAMATALPTVVFDLGAQAERLQDYPMGLRLPLDLVDTPAAINDQLMAFAQQHYPLTEDQV